MRITYCFSVFKLEIPDSISQQCFDFMSKCVWSFIVNGDIMGKEYLDTVSLAESEKLSEVYNKIIENIPKISFYSRINVIESYKFNTPFIKGYCDNNIISLTMVSDLKNIITLQHNMLKLKNL